MHEGVFGAKGEWFKRSLCRKVWNEKGTLFWRAAGNGCGLQMEWNGMVSNRRAQVKVKWNGIWNNCIPLTMILFI